MATDPVNLYIAASNTKTQVNDLLQTTRMSGISFEALRRENEDLKARCTELEQSLIQEVEGRKSETSTALAYEKDLEATQQELQSLQSIVVILQTEIHTILGISTEPQAQSEVPLPNNSETAAEEALQVPETVTNS